MENQINLNNLNVVITGASQGFGFEIAKKFSELGANILITSRSIDKLKIAKKEILKNSKGLVEILKADISIKIDNFKTAEYAISKFGRIDVLVANAGVYGPKGKIEKDEELTLDYKSLPMVNIWQKSFFSEEEVFKEKDVE